MIIYSLPSLAASASPASPCMHARSDQLLCSAPSVPPSSQSGCRADAVCHWSPLISRVHQQPDWRGKLYQRARKRGKGTEGKQRREESESVHASAKNLVNFCLLIDMRTSGLPTDPSLPQSDACVAREIEGPRSSKGGKMQRASQEDRERQQEAAHDGDRRWCVILVTDVFVERRCCAHQQLQQQRQEHEARQDKRHSYSP